MNQSSETRVSVRRLNSSFGLRMLNVPEGGREILLFENCFCERMGTLRPSIYWVKFEETVEARAEAVTEKII